MVVKFQVVKKRVLTTKTIIIYYNNKSLLKVTKTSQIRKRIGIYPSLITIKLNYLISRKM